MQCINRKRPAVRAQEQQGAFKLCIEKGAESTITQYSEGPFLLRTAQDNALQSKRADRVQSTHSVSDTWKKATHTDGRVEIGWVGDGDERQQAVDGSTLISQVVPKYREDPGCSDNRQFIHS